MDRPERREVPVISPSIKIPASRWTLREASESDRDAIIALRKIVFTVEDPEKQQPSFWWWEFMAGPEGKARMFVAEDDGMIVGHYAIVPQTFEFAGESVKGSIVVDLMTHPDYRRQGIFNKIAQFSFAKVSDEIDFASAYPIRKESMAGFLSIGWVEQLKIPVLVRPLAWPALAQRFRLPFGQVLRLLAAPWRLIRRIASAKLCDGEEVRILGVESCAQLAEVAAEGLSQKTVYRARTEQYFRWRYFESPVWKYQITGLFRDEKLRSYVVTRHAKLLDTSCLAIVDLGCLADADRELDILLNGMIAEGISAGLAVAGSMITRGNRYFRALRRAGFYPGPHRFSLILYSTHAAFRQRLLDPKIAWFLTWGDTDGV